MTRVRTAAARRGPVSYLLHLVGLTLLLAAPTARSAQLPTAATQPTLVIRNGTLLDGTGSAPVGNATVVVTGDRITRVTTEDVPAPPDARVVDAAGLTILPGLIDAHVHSQAWMWPLFLRFGVTTVRDVGSDPDFILRERARERAGELLAPRIFACGPLLDGVPPVWGTQWRGSVGLSTVDEARAAAQRLADRGVDCLKVYARLPLPLMRAVLEIAQGRGIPVAGHVGAVSARDAVELGVRSIEHASGISFPLEPAVQDSLIRFFISRGTFVVPTLLASHNVANLPTVANEQYPNLHLVPEGTRRWWLDWRRSDFRFRQADDRFFARWQERVKAVSAFTLAFHRAGGKVVAGSDTPNPFVVPGSGLHQELELLVQAGLSPMEALVSATSRAAELLGRQDLGTVAEGKLADLLLVAGNPAADLAALSNIRAVVKAGKVVHEQR